MSEILDTCGGTGVAVVLCTAEVDREEPTLVCQQPHFRLKVAALTRP
jgi:hypothetical protein